MTNHYRDSGLRWVRECMPAESAAALATFTRINAHFRGAEWDDCLDIMLDADANLEVTEPIYEALQDSDYLHLVSPVALTLLYASEAFGDLSVEAQTVIVSDTIEKRSVAPEHDDL